MSDVEQSGAFDAIARELESGDCVGAAHVAVSLGHEIVWGSLDAISDLALLEIDGVISCSAPTVLLSSGDRRNMIKLRPLRASRPDPEPADPDSDSGSPDQSRPDPEPANPNDSGCGTGGGTSPDQNRPDPEPATGGATTTTTTNVR